MSTITYFFAEEQKISIVLVETNALFGSLKFAD